MFYDKTKNGYVLRVRLTPNSSCCQINDLYQDAFGTVYLKIAVSAVPDKGKANKALIVFLAESLKVPKSLFKIVSGEHERYKKIEILTSDDLEDVFEKMIKEQK